MGGTLNEKPPPLSMIFNKPQSNLRISSFVKGVKKDLIGEQTMENEEKLLNRITYNPNIFGGKPIVRGRRLPVEHVLGMMAAGDSMETILDGYPWLEREDILACLAYAHRMVGHERVEPLLQETGT
jgi:uncharacterized protein (DUF433 family)